MPLRNWRMGAALLASLAVLPATYVHAEDKAPAGASSAEKPSDTSVSRQAIEWSQERLAELDATIAILEKNAAELQGRARAKADASLKQLRDTRDAYRTKLQETLDNSRTWTEAQMAAGRKALDDGWTTFRSETEAYLADVQADFATRKAVLTAQIEVRQKALQDSVESLKADAGKLAKSQRAAIESRIAALDTQVEEAKARLTRLKEASSDSWESAKQSYADVQKRISETYLSIRKSISDAVK